MIQIIIIGNPNRKQNIDKNNKNIIYEHNTYIYINIHIYIYKQR